MHRKLRTHFLILILIVLPGVLRAAPQLKTVEIAEDCGTCSFSYDEARVSEEQLVNLNKLKDGSFDEFNPFFSICGAVVGRPLLCRGPKPTTKEFQTKGTEYLAEAGKHLKKLETMALPKGSDELRQLLTDEVKFELWITETELKYASTDLLKTLNTTYLDLDVGKGCGAIAKKLHEAKGDEKWNQLDRAWANCVRRLGTPRYINTDKSIELFRKLWKANATQVVCDRTVDCD